MRLDRCLVVAFCLFELACTTNATDGQCISIDDCGAGEVCVSGSCKTVCVEHSQCPAGSICANGVCDVGAGADDPPEIHAVDGTGTVDGSDGRVGHRLTDRLVVTGDNLLGATAELTGPDPSATVYPLEACAAGTNAQMVLGLPPTLLAGDYTLTVNNQAGGACTGLSILKGEDGQDGSLLNGDLLYVNVDGDVMSGDLSVSGQVAIWTSSSAASLSARAAISNQITGVVTSTGATSQVTGVGTQFTTELEVDDAIEIESVTYTVTGILSDTSMTVNPQPAAFLNVDAFTGGPILELQDLAGATKVLVDRRGRVATPRLDVLGDIHLSGVMTCSHCVDTADVADGTLTNADINAAAAIAASKINRAGLDADSVDGREPTVSLYSCPVSCSASGFDSQCPCFSAGTVSTSNTVTCSGPDDWDFGCTGFRTGTCNCNLMGYLMSP